MLNYFFLFFYSIHGVLYNIFNYIFILHLIIMGLFLILSLFLYGLITLLPRTILFLNFLSYVNIGLFIAKFAIMLPIFTLYRIVILLFLICLITSFCFGVGSFIYLLFLIILVNIHYFLFISADAL